MEKSKNGWFIMEHSIKKDDLGVSPCQETTNLSSKVVPPPKRSPTVPPSPPFPWPAVWPRGEKVWEMVVKCHLMPWTYREKVYRNARICQTKTHLSHDTYIQLKHAQTSH